MFFYASIICRNVRQKVSPQHISYRLINLIFQKNGRDFEKLQRALNPMELAASMNNLTKEQRLEYLEKTFQETVEEYSKVIERLGMASD